MEQVTPKLSRQYPSIVSVVLVAWVSIGPVGSVSARSHKVGKRPAVRVVVYNYAHVGRSGLRDAENQAAALFAGAGVRIEWTDYLQKRRPDRFLIEISNADFFLRILPARMARQWNYKPGALGESVFPSGTEGPLPGRIANVFYDRVINASSAWGRVTAEVLGDAIAHELGHLLLGPGHSRQGIMKAHWTSLDLLVANRGNLRFSPAQITMLQRAARSLQRNGPVRLAARE